MARVNLGRGPRRAADPSGEHGAYAVLFLVLLVVLTMLAALVVDLGGMFFTRRAGKAVSDLAAVAGAYDLEPTTGGSPLDGCEAAWSYVLLNLPGQDGTASSDCAAAFGPSAPPCDPTTPRSTDPVKVGDYEVAITIPVINDSAMMESRFEPDIDGTNPCTRLGVSILRNHNFLFTGLGGISNGETGASSVARAQVQDRGDDLVALLILEPESCNALVASGQGKVIVKYVTIDGEHIPGAITVDSDGTGGSGSDACSNSNRYTIEVRDSGNTLVEAQETPDGVKGILFAHALMPGNGIPHAYEDADVTAGRLVPRPLGNDRITRAPLDHRYNCKSGYPAHLGVPVEDCPNTATVPPHIDQLVARVGSGQPAGFDSYNDHATALGVADPCNVTQPIVIPAGDWYVDCPRPNAATEGFRVSNNGEAVFEGGEIVFRDGIDVSGNPSDLEVGLPGQQSIVYLQAGNFTKGSQAGLILEETFVYMEDGAVQLEAGSTPLTWIAPDEETFEFDDLALWSNTSPERHTIGGQAALDLEGTFFTPFAAPFEYKGQGEQIQTQAQFVSRRLEASGQGTLEMSPDPDRITPVSLQGVRLIR